MTIFAMSIDGESVRAADTFGVHNPSTGEVAGYSACWPLVL